MGVKIYFCLNRVFNITGASTPINPAVSMPLVLTSYMCSRDCHAVEITIQFINTLKIGQQAFCLLYQMMMMMMLMICSAWCNT